MRVYLILLVSVLVTACTDNSDRNAKDEPNPQLLLQLHAEPDLAAGGSIVDELDREVLLRGVNVNAFAHYWKSSDYPTTFPFTADDAQLMATFGWNTVRLLLSWSLVEPSPGNYDEAYLDTIEGAVETLAQNGIYTIIDLHQDAWSATLAARDDEMCPANTQPALGWDGAPSWATLDDGQPRCTIAETRETSAAVRAAWVAFWQNSPGPDGIGIQTRYAQMLGHIAARFATHVTVAGYDIMNEPNVFTPAELNGLSNLYEASISEIRTAESQANGFSHLIFFEPSILWSSNGEGPPNHFAHDSNVVYSPHIYTGGFDDGPITGEAFQVARDEAMLFGGAPVFSGEWGGNPDRAEPDGDSYFLDHLRYQDDFQIGSTLWTWRESCGDPHKAADYRAGKIPVVWGLFDVDCSNNVIRGLRVDLADQLTRPALRAAPGRIAKIEYDPVSGSFRASGSDSSGGQLVIFYPSAKHGSPTLLNSVGLGKIEEYEAPGGSLYLVADSTASDWSLALSP